MEEKQKIKIPNHIAIIPDGCEKWAKERNLQKIDGYKKGIEITMKAPFWFSQAGVGVLSVLLFSSEDWEREKEEVNILMKSIKSAMFENSEELNRKKYKILVSGHIDDLPGDLPEICFDLMDKTKNNSGIILNLCINYGGREEIIDAFKKMMKNKIEPEQVHPGMIKKYLYNGDLDNPDLIVKTSGKKILSGFQLWQSVHSELLFMNKYWPDFEESDVNFILKEYYGRIQEYL